MLWYFSLWQWQKNDLFFTLVTFHLKMCQMLLKSVQSTFQASLVLKLWPSRNWDKFLCKVRHFLWKHNILFRVIIKKKSLYVTAFCSLSESAGRLKTATCQVCWDAQPQGGDYRKANDCPRRIRRYTDCQPVKLIPSKKPNGLSGTASQLRFQSLLASPSQH